MATTSLGERKVRVEGKNLNHLETMLKSPIIQVKKSHYYQLLKQRWKVHLQVLGSDVVRVEMGSAREALYLLGHTWTRCSIIHFLFDTRCISEINSESFIRFCLMESSYLEEEDSLKSRGRALD